MVKKQPRVIDIRSPEKPCVEDIERSSVQIHPNQDGYIEDSPQAAKKILDRQERRSHRDVAAFLWSFLSYFKNPLVAALQLIILTVLLWCTSYFTSHSWISLQLYRPNIGQVEGRVVARTLARSTFCRKKTCILLGGSSLREGFGEKVMEQIAPEFCFFNGGTGGGGVYMTSLIVQIIDWYNVKPDCIILGLNSRMLVNRLDNTDHYEDHMDYWNSYENLMNHTHYPQFDRLENVISGYFDKRNYQRMINNTIWPMYVHSSQVSVLFRLGIYHLQRNYSWRSPIEKNAFWKFRQEFASWPTSFYDGQPYDPDVLRIHMKSFRELGLFERNRYGQKEHIDNMRRILDTCLAITPNVVVVVMPEHGQFRDSAGSYADKPFWEILHEYETKDCLILDRRKSFPDKMLRDIGHLLPEGRDILSRQVAKEVIQYVRRNENR